MSVVAILGIVFFFLAIISFLKVRNSHEKIGFIYPWGWPIGAFVWEDLFVFSLLGTITTIIVTVLHDLRVGYLFFLVFWIVRSAGETLYFFLQQFSQPTVYPHQLKDHFKTMHKIFGSISDQKCYILLQIFQQSILVCSLVALILLLIHWQSIA
jgi:hypothetical protein